MTGTLAGALEARHIAAYDGSLETEVEGDIEEGDNKVLLLTKVHIKYKMKPPRGHEHRPSARWHCTMRGAQCRNRSNGAFTSSGAPRSPRCSLWTEPRHSSSMPTARSSMCIPWSRPCRR